MSGTMTNRRVTREEIMKAFHDTGLRPMTGGWISYDHTEACGLGAIMEAREIPLPVYPTVSRIAHLLNLQPSYVDGFVDGWDMTGVTSQNEIYKRAYTDGVVARCAMNLPMDED